MDDCSGPGPHRLRAHGSSFPVNSAAEPMQHASTSAQTHGAPESASHTRTGMTQIGTEGGVRAAHCFRAGGSLLALAALEPGQVRQDPVM